jgi:hypothetical protein
MKMEGIRQKKIVGRSFFRAHKGKNNPVRLITGIGNFRDIFKPANWN